jgi:hypothetical protein
MQSSLATRLRILATIVAVAGCDGTTTLPDSASELGAAMSASTPGEIHLLGEFALYMPTAPDGPRAVIVALGGPSTRAVLVTGEDFVAPPPVIPALRALGVAMRAFADEQGVAILGTSRFGPFALPNDVASDALILDALAAGAAASGRAELTSVPMLLFGLSGGGPEVSGFAARHPDKVAGVFLKAPLGVAMLTDAPQREVPTFLALAELEDQVDNAMLAVAHASNRSGGALWAIATEPAAVHFSYSDALRNATIEWMRSIMARRVAGSSGTIQRSVAASGWLGDPSTGAVPPWGQYRGDRSAVNWFPSQRMAGSWQSLIGAAAGN